MNASFWKTWVLSRLFGTARRPVGARTTPRRRRRLSLEQLETRCTPATILVTNAGDATSTGDGVSLREAILSIDQGSNFDSDVVATGMYGTDDTIEFAAGLSGQTITLGGSELSITRAVTVTGLGAAELAVSANNQSRVFDVAAGITVAISGLTIEDGSAPQSGGQPSEGGAIINAGTLTLTDVVVQGSVAQGSTGSGGHGGTGGFGGGIYNSGTLDLVTSTVTGNEAVGGNGESGNAAGSGGGAGLGGGVFNAGTGTLTIERSTLSDNSAVGGQGGDGGTSAGAGAGAGMGGAVFNAAGTATVDNSTLAFNTAQGGSGGGDTGTVDIPGGGGSAGGFGQGGSQFGGTGGFGGGGGGADSSGSGGFGGGASHGTPGFGAGKSGGFGGGFGAALGGALFNMDLGSMTLTQDTIADNQAAGAFDQTGSPRSSTGQGGGLFVENASASVKVLDTLFAANTGRAAFDGSTTNENVHGTITSEGFNLSSDNSGSGWVSGDLLNTNPQLGPLADNGGPTETMALPLTSPAIDKGGPVPNGSAVDQRGFPRVVDLPGFANATGGDGSDIGAFEFQTATITVNSTADNTTDTTVLTLRDAVELPEGTLTRADLSPQQAAQVQGDVGGVSIIQFDPSLDGQTIVLEIALPTLDHDVTIQGPGSAELTIERDTTAGTPDFGIFDVEGSLPVAISGLTLADGVADGEGGAIFNSTTLTLTDVDFEDNTATEGGGAIFNEGKLTVSNSTFTGNQAGTSGSGDGGGIANFGSLTVSTSTFSGNSAQDGGGLSNESSLSVISSTFAGNTAVQDGGAIANSDGSLTLDESTVGGNTAGGNGGGIYNDATLTITDSTVAFNHAGSTGPGQGGGLFIDSDPPPADIFLANTIVADNVSGTGATPDDVNGGVSRESTGNLIGNASGASGFSPSNGNLLNVDPRLGPLANNGGPTLTYTLLFGSPAIDAGNNSAVPSGDTDQRGQPRIVNVTGAATAVVDIGAVELSSLPPPPPAPPPGSGSGSTTGTGQLVVNVVFTQPSGSPFLQAFDAATGGLLFEVPITDLGLRDGATWALGDVNGDGVPDIVLVPRRKHHHPTLVVLDGRTGAVLFSVRISTRFEGPFSVMVLDPSGQGFGTIVVSAPHFLRFINLLDPATLRNG
jgi:predicted outer membrane repeat protein